jgi:hypothetical protein
LKRSHYGLVETMQVKNLLNPEGFLPGENNPDHRANTWHELMNSIMKSAPAGPSTSRSRTH